MDKKKLDNSREELKNIYFQLQKDEMEIQKMQSGTTNEFQILV
jgi:hypothetical protein